MPALPPLVEPAPGLSDDEAERTSRTARLPEIGELGQRRLAAARIAVVGAGGIGSPVLLYLAAAGVGTLGVFDDDAVDTSNLQRQVLHGVGDLGRSKARSAADAVLRLSPETKARVHELRLTAENALAELAGYDLVIDGSDNFDTRYVVDDACAELGIPLVWGAVLRFDAQMSVFWARPREGVDASGVRLRDLFPQAPAPDAVPSCSVAGVLGPMCGQVGALMASEAIKLVCGVGDVALGRVVVIDALAGTQRAVPLRARAGSAGRSAGESAPGRASGGTPPPASAPVSSSATDLGVSTLDPAHIAERLSIDHRIRVVDVREPRELALGTMPDAVNVPLGELLRDPSLVPPGPVVLVCSGEERSLRAARALARAGRPGAVVVRGGYPAWAAYARTHPDVGGAVHDRARGGGQPLASASQPQSPAQSPSSSSKGADHGSAHR